MSRLWLASGQMGCVQRVHPWAEAICTKKQNTTAGRRLKKSTTAPCLSAERSTHSLHKHAHTNMLTQTYVVRATRKNVILWYCFFPAQPPFLCGVPQPNVAVLHRHALSMAFFCPGDTMNRTVEA